MEAAAHGHSTLGIPKKVGEEFVGKDAEPRTLYVSRALVNGAELVAWAKAQGFGKTLPVEDLHVTAAFSRAPVDWGKLTPAETGMTQAGGPRSLEKLGDKGAVVLRFESGDLAERHSQIEDAGASWDWPSYKPHVTITYDGGDVDLAEVEPFEGVLEFGPERFAEIDEDWFGKIKAAADADIPTRIDRTHEVEWMSVLSRDGQTMYVDCTLPHAIENNGKSLDPAHPLLRHEGFEYAEMQRRLAEFKAKHGRKPNADERKAIYLKSHYHAGNPAERQWIEANGYSWPEWEAWCRGELARLENRKITNPAPDPDVKPFPHRHGEIEMTMDAVLAFDRDSVREYDRDGRLHVKATNISKAAVNPYLGHEITDFDKLGLDPGKIYKLLRHPEELERAAPTFNGIQLLRKHIPVSADDHQPYDVVGATGTDAEFAAPFLRNSLVIWVRPDIEDIESGAKKELSCGYRYRADMTPGTYEGEPYDGVMRDIVGNHVALVEEGRAGPDVVVGDAAIPLSLENTDMATKPVVLTRKAAVAQGALLVYLQPKLAADAKLDLAAVLAGVTTKNFKAKRPDIVAGIKKQIEGKLAKDASIEALGELLDTLDKTEVPEGADIDPSSGLPVAAMTEPKDTGMDTEGLSPEEEAQYQALAKRRKPAAMDESEEDKKKREEEEARAKSAKDEEKDMVTKPAMDAAIKQAKAEGRAEAVTDTMKRLNDIRTAERAVAPLIGEVKLGLDSADAIYLAALKAHDVPTDGVDPSAFPAMVAMLSRHKAAPRPAPHLATDHDAIAAFKKSIGDDRSIRVLG